jgi:predicted nucleic acid-binding protein
MTEGRNRPAVYLDSNVFISFIQGDAADAETLKNLFSAMQGRVGVFVTSELTLAEVLAPTKARGPLSPLLRRRYIDLIVWNSAVSLQPVSRTILYETAELRRFTSQKLPDAIHIVTAVQTRCRFLMSHDRDMKRTPSGMTFVDIDDAGVKTLIEALRD